MSELRHPKFTHHAIQKLIAQIDRQPKHAELDEIYFSIKDGRVREIVRGRGKHNRIGVTAYEVFVDKIALKVVIDDTTDKIITIIGRRERASGVFRLGQILGRERIDGQN